MKNVEKQCCSCQNEKGCVLNDEEFRTVVLRQAVIRAALNGRRLTVGRSALTGIVDNDAMRHQAYKNYIYHLVGATGSGNRKVSQLD